MNSSKGSNDTRNPRLEFQTPQQDSARCGRHGLLVLEPRALRSVVLNRCNSDLYLPEVVYFFQPEKAPSWTSWSPFVGNVFQVPLHKPWLYFEELGRNYGMS